MSRRTLASPLVACILTNWACAASTSQIVPVLGKGLSKPITQARGEEPAGIQTP